MFTVIVDVTGQNGGYGQSLYACGHGGEIKAKFVRMS